MKTFLSAVTVAFLSMNAFIVHAEDAAPKNLLIKKDQNGEIFVHRSNESLGKIDKSNAKDLDKLKFEKLSDLKDINVDSLTSATDELDRDLPRQSWYVYWGYGYVYPYYPVYYASYVYYPYYNYFWSGCQYYWYRW